MNRDNFERAAGYVVFAVLIVVFFAFGPVALTRAVGVVLAAGGVYSFLQGSIPYGIEGREPSGHLTGTMARLISAAIVLFGVATVVAAPKAACILGWAEPGGCA